MRGVFYLKKKDIWKIVFAVTITALFALLSSYFTDTSSEWYMALEKPSIQPPPIVFAIAWPIIYVLFAASFSVFAHQKQMVRCFFVHHQFNINDTLVRFVFCEA